MNRQLSVLCTLAVFFVQPDSSCKSSQHDDRDSADASADLPVVLRRAARALYVGPQALGTGSTAPMLPSGHRAKLWYPAVWRRVLSPAEIQRAELCVRRLREIEGSELYTYHAGQWVQAFIANMTADLFHAALVPELLRFCRHHALSRSDRAREDVSLVVWRQLVRGVANMGDRRVPIHAYRWLRSQNDALKELGRELLRGRDLAPWERAEELLGQGHDSRTGLPWVLWLRLWPRTVGAAVGVRVHGKVATPKGELTPAIGVGSLASGDQVTHVQGVLASVEYAYRMDPSRIDNQGYWNSEGEAVRETLKAVVRSEHYPVWQRARAAQLLPVGSELLLLELATRQPESFADEVLAIAATCRLATLGRFSELLTVLERGCESAAFQAASHLRYIGGYPVPGLLRGFYLEGYPVFALGYSADVARWLAYPESRRSVARYLRRLKPGREWRRWRFHRHVDVHELKVWVEVPEEVLIRSLGEDPFWRRLPTPEELREERIRLRNLGAAGATKAGDEDSKRGADAGERGREEGQGKAGASVGPKR